MQPATTEEVAEIVRIARSAGVAVVARGGGMSYTLAHTPARPETIVVDLRRMNHVVELNVADRYVTVEAGVTWDQLAETLRGTGHWLTFNGTLSGLYATVGGTLSQNSVGLGRGWLSDVVLGMEVVLGDGRVVQTGSGAAHGTPPFGRTFGPDLGGLFLGDSGVFGFKARDSTGVVEIATFCLVTACFQFPIAAATPPRPTSTAKRIDQREG